MLNKRLKITIPVFLALLCIICLCVTGLFSDYPDNTGQNNAQSNPSDISDEYKIFQNQNGLFGINDATGNEIISPQWNSITRVSDECFIISKKINGSELFGMIDSDENVISAIAYESLFYDEKNNLIIGKPQGSNSCMLIKKDGSLYTDTAWDSYEISENNIILSKNRSKYYALFSDNEIIFTSFKLLRSCAGISFSFSGDFSKYDGKISYKTVEHMADTASSYIHAVAMNDHFAIRNTTSAEYYSNIIPPEYLGMNIKNISDAVISINNSEIPVSYTVSMKIDYEKPYEVTETTATQYSYQYSQTSEPVSQIVEDKEINTADFVITMEKDKSGFMIVKSVYYIG